MSDLEDTPSLHKFPQNIVRESAENKKKYFDDAFRKFIDKFLLQKVNANDFCNDDYVMNYAHCCIFLAVLVMQMDTAAESHKSKTLAFSFQVYGCMQQVCNRNVCEYSPEWVLLINSMPI